MTIENELRRIADALEKLATNGVAIEMEDAGDGQMRIIVKPGGFEQLLSAEEKKELAEERKALQEQKSAPAAANPCAVGSCPKGRQMYQECPDAECTLSGRRPFETVELEINNKVAAKQTTNAAIRRERMLSAMTAEGRAAWLLEQIKLWGAAHPWVAEQARKINEMNAAEAPAPTEPPKKKRGRPSKADLAARADTVMDKVQEEVRADEEAHVVEQKAAALPVEEKPNAETEKAIEKAREPVLTIEKVREAAIALTQRCEKEKAGSGREALVAALAKFSAKSISELPEAKWPEFVSSLKAT